MKPRLSLGPVFFHWEAAALRDFYFRIADEAAVDIVYLGEVVCSKRAPFFLPHLESVLDRLRTAGKSVVLSTLALIASERERAQVRELCATDELIEANDVGTLALLAGRPHVIGPFVNVYNEAALSYFARRGAVRACLPAELPAASLRPLAGTGAAELELMVWGRLPLAISARCFHARLHRLHKDGCQFVCAKDPEGRLVRTLEGEPFLAINGLQTLSHTWCNLAAEIPALLRSGAGVFRLVPMPVDMVAVAATFRAVLDGSIETGDALARLQRIAPAAVFANGFMHGRAGRDYVRSRLADAE